MRTVLEQLLKDVEEIINEHEKPRIEFSSYVYDPKRKRLLVLLPGVKKEDVAVKIRGKKLKIEAKAPELTEKPIVYEFTMANDLEVDKAYMSDGLLRILFKEKTSEQEIKIE